MKLVISILFGLLLEWFSPASGVPSAASAEKDARCASGKLSEWLNIDFGDATLQPTAQNTYSVTVKQWQQILNFRIRAEKRSYYRLFRSDNTHLNLHQKYHEINHLLDSVDFSVLLSSFRHEPNALQTFYCVYRI